MTKPRSDDVTIDKTGEMTETIDPETGEVTIVDLDPLKVVPDDADDDFPGDRPLPRKRPRRAPTSAAKPISAASAITRRV